MTEFKPATPSLTKIRAAILGGPGCGKTFGALMLARGLVQAEGRVAVIDTERGRSNNYAAPKFARKIGLYDVADLDPPFTSARFVESILRAEELGYDAIIVDSLSHEWTGVGGLLEQVDASGGKAQAWKIPKKEHRRLMEVIVRCRAHVICTIRQREALEFVTVAGQTQVRRGGMKAIQDDETEYEFDLVLATNRDNEVSLQKCNSGYRDIVELAITRDRKVTPALGAQLAEWITTEGAISVAAEPEPAKEPPVPPVPEQRSEGEGAVWLTPVLEKLGHQSDEDYRALERVAFLADDEALIPEDARRLHDALAASEGSEDGAREVWASVGYPMKGRRPTGQEARQMIEIMAGMRTAKEVQA